MSSEQEIGKVHLDAPSLRRDVQVKMVFARDKGTRPDTVHAVTARLRALDALDFRSEDAKAERAPFHLAHGDRLRAYQASPARAKHLARGGDRRLRAQDFTGVAASFSMRSAKSRTSA
jgi:hypothetical protein